MTSEKAAPAMSSKFQRQGFCALDVCSVNDDRYAQEKDEQQTSASSNKDQVKVLVKQALQDIRDLIKESVKEELVKETDKQQTLASSDEYQIRTLVKQAIKDNVAALVKDGFKELVQESVVTSFKDGVSHVKIQCKTITTDIANDTKPSGLLDKIASFKTLNKMCDNFVKFVPGTVMTLGVHYFGARIVGEENVPKAEKIAVLFSGILLVTPSPALCEWLFPTTAQQSLQDCDFIWSDHAPQAKLAGEAQ